MATHNEVRAVLFDLDGTLVDTLPDIAWSLNHILVRHGLATLPLQQVRAMIGGGVSAMIERAAKGLDAQRQEQLLADYAQCYQGNLVQRSRVFAGCLALLETVAAKGLPMVVVTNKAQALAEQVVEALLPRPGFVAVLGHRQGAALKPAPDIALQASRLLEVAPAHCLFVGDTPTDLLTAQAAGMPAAAVAWGYGGREALLEQRPRFFCEQPLHLLRALRPEPARPSASHPAAATGSR
ncbi:HAD family hydrolase [Pseudomonas muyukensis]|uniref:HAD-IA family hydrolase n=1 Tax=Pseudomonas muyukensis TaxID=2842357 RepID=A0ABX8M7T8_9PSED|nr:HAD-IA family hydrolase [Pseudomonas muyukensis]QXH35043.1 HAD-IA family hydrolase [Pseudomonas muyukensis]